MKRVLILITSALLSVASGRAATVPIFLNDTPVDAFEVPPQIDATAFINTSDFNVDVNLSSVLVPGNLGVFSDLPYETANTLYFTNEASGIMSVFPGFRFDYKTNVYRKSMRSWVNYGSITTGDTLWVNSSNIVNSGFLESGASGLVRLVGNRIDINRSGIRTGNPVGTSSAFAFSGGRNFTFINSYDNAPGVFDTWWGVGTNGTLAGNGKIVPLNGFTPNFTLPNPSSPVHEVIESFSGFTFTNKVSLPIVSFLNWGAFAYTNQTSPTNFTIQVVFIPTNNIDPTLTNSVRFSPDTDNGATAIVGIKGVGVDLATGLPLVDEVYLLDSMAFDTNNVLFRNQIGNTRRPRNYELVRAEPFEYTLGLPPNALFDNTLLYNSSYLSNSVTMAYAGYAAQIATAGFTNSSAVIAQTQPTNFPGRVEIVGDTLNMDQARIRAESTVVIKSSNLISNRVARIDAPFMSVDVRSKQPTLTISNIAPSDVRRLSGNIYAWSGIWQNIQTNLTSTNYIDFHVLFVDNDLSTIAQVQLYEFGAHATNIVIQDNLNITRWVVLDATSLCVEGGLTFPPRFAWASSNVLNLLNFTNHGNITVPSAAYYGTDRVAPYNNFVNSGSNSASGQFIRSRYFENSGAIRAESGSILLDTPNGLLFGLPLSTATNVGTSFIFDPVLGFTNIVTTNVFTNQFGGELYARGNVEIKAGSLSMSNALLVAGAGSPGRLILTVTNSLKDAGSNQITHWDSGAGFDMRRRPTTSDLLHTYLRTRAVRNQASAHTWAAIDRGATVSGYSNNLALGKLTVDGEPNTLFTFSSAGGTASAIYVDYLELLNNATNFSTAFAIAPNFTIYFANANIPAEHIDGAAGGRIRWVQNFTGPLSSTNITYPSGTTYTFNTALVESKDIDSDGDGTVNADDPTPILTGETVGLSVTVTNTPTSHALLSWYSPTNSIGYVEYSTNVLSAWRPLTAVTNRSASATATYLDQSSAPGVRIYRVRVDQFAP